MERKRRNDAENREGCDSDANGEVMAINERKETEESRKVMRSAEKKVFLL